MNILLERLYQNAKEKPAREALVGDYDKHNYESLLEASIVLSNQIIANKVTTLALLADNGPDWIIVDLACQIAQCCFIPLPLFFTSSQIEHSLTQAGVDMLITGPDITLPTTFDQINTSQTITLKGLSHGFKAVRLPLFSGTTKPDKTHKITFTSGSTGKPKGVCLSNEQQMAVATSLDSIIAIKQPRHLCVLPLVTLLENVAGVYAPMLSAGTIYVPSLATLGMSGSSQIDVRKLLVCIDNFQPETMILIPQLLDVLIMSVMKGWKPPKDLQMIAVGGSRVAPSTIHQARKLGLPVYEGYGLSECASVVSLNTPDHDQLGSAGRLLPHIKIQISDGEINIVGNTFLGYLNEPDSWLPDYVNTGDLGYIDDDGFVQLQGRKKNLLISSFGRNINPEWVESELLAHALIQQCIVVGDAKPHYSALIYADIKHISDAEIQRWIDNVNQSLPDYAQIPAWIRLQKPLSTAENLLTENGRAKREAIYRFYSNEIEQLYSPTQESISA